MLYPGDLEGGAENVANCRCWLQFTNITPSNLKTRGTIQINPNVNLTTNNAKTYSVNTESKGKTRKPNINEYTSSNKKQGLFSKIKTRILNIGNKNTSKITKPEIKSNKNSININYNKDPHKVVEVNNKKIYGVGESIEDKLAFSNKWAIKKSDLSKKEYNFVKLYSGDVTKILNNYLREIAIEPNNFKRKLIHAKFMIKWNKFRFKYPKEYMPLNEYLKISETIFEKGKVLDEDLVLVRRQSRPLSDYANEGIYHSDAFLSTSISMNVKPELYGPYINLIVVPKGTKIFYIEKITSTKTEYEVLFNKGSDLKFLNQENKYISSWILI
ncbi:ADP-ribosyltransferase exoenzyme [Methanobrevibacter olleyae]|uniref:ADP-ribosyltransferase exoenzyme n=1 Tax=Methanobrevibacter olleyae TaxID=294671 RepID=A0A1I4JI30_METOL|nr:ADP-ribosyltransferase [Methanobrevibacter olleyae]SFL65786.1 ADP-ribosyltransferase exoenzyme [Methanobrevibacter olleyae]